ncbi:MAG: YggS family pyridoxal phosphate-dependent enzyme [Steroidobacteraceae bacterium]
MLTAPQIPAERLAAVRERITVASREAGRDPASITLIGVAKSQPLERVRSALDAGLCELGENYVQEARAHFGALGGRSFGRHFIGALQSNKTRDAAQLFDWVHTVDRTRIAERLSAQRPDAMPPLSVCIQLRLGDESTKGGVSPAGLAGLADAVARLPRLRLRGLMCLPPEENEPARQRRWFAELRRLRDRLNAAGHRLDALSMGMSGDFEAAIAEGATHLRIGTAIFGPRD